MYKYLNGWLFNGEADILDCRNLYICAVNIYVFFFFLLGICSDVLKAMCHNYILKQLINYNYLQLNKWKPVIKWYTVKTDYKYRTQQTHLNHLFFFFSPE